MRHLAALLTGLLALSSLTLSAQDCNGADHTILAGGFYYEPATLTITAGETVAWINEGGFHDVNGNISVLTGASFGNPEMFSLPSVNASGMDVCMGTVTFTVPGTYNYDCSVGNHAASGMVGTIIVEEAVVESGCNDTLACNYDEAATSDVDCLYNDGDLDLSDGIWVMASAFLDPDLGCDIEPAQGLLVQMTTDPNEPLSIAETQELTDYINDMVDMGLIDFTSGLILTSAFDNAVFSFCGGFLSGVAGLNSIEADWNGSTWTLPLLGFTMAPAAEMMAGCPDPAATNFDPCANPDPGSCEYEEADGCNDPLACNYDSTAAGIADCNYFDTELFTLEENDFIGLFDYESCPDGYAGAYSVPVPLGQDTAGGPLFFTLFEEVEDFLIYYGFDIAAQDLSTVTMSVCDTVLNYNSLVLGDIDMIWDGTGFPNEFYESFVVPESSLPSGCADDEACNFDPCGHPFVEEGCEYLESGTVVGDTLVEPGGTVTFTATPGEGNDFEWSSDCATIEENNEIATLTVTEDCEVCFLEYNSDSCGAELCFNVSVITSVDENGRLPWQFMPNPAADALRVVWGGEATVFDVLDLNGRRVHTATVYRGVTTLDLSSLQPGLYLAGPQGTEPQRIAIQR